MENKPLLNKEKNCGICSIHVFELFAWNKKHRRIDAKKRFILHSRRIEFVGISGFLCGEDSEIDKARGYILRSKSLDSILECVPLTDST